MSQHNKQFYIDGAWVDPIEPALFPVINPANESVIGEISLGSRKDIDKAVAAARKAFLKYSQESRAARILLLKRIIDAFERRQEMLAQAITQEMGSPITFSRQVQTINAVNHFKEMVEVLEQYEFVTSIGRAQIVREPIGVCGLITPWNWPLNLTCSKLASALAAGCTVVLKPSEVAPLSSILLAEVLHEAAVPAGVFNLVNGEGPVVGDAIASHPDVDMVSITGSTRAGVLVAKAAATTVKRVTQELGGKSANIILRGTDLEKTVKAGVMRCYTNAGQSCQAPSRMLVHRDDYDAAIAIAKQTADAIVQGNPAEERVQMGPVVSKAQYDMIQGMIQSGIDQGATLISGGVGLPEDMLTGYYVRPTIFADVRPDMSIARDEIFGPVLSILPYDTEDQAVQIANDSPYGLAGYVQAATMDEARRVGLKIRAGRIYLNGTPGDNRVPLGGYKQSGNGREHGVYGLESYLEVKALLGAA
ncbi:aldehyde dehydrogenase family protein [Sinorhizobium medicae]|uniref:aldehyde dehydrogenase family protein n=1 Tax=Sinorhizobium medicae TaxID=110321 RepID=UPI000FDAF626|nr:aldehyde dehydrogenase family protein [Sinorhizobium medicae]RVO69937.1 aldehyde dehydrogenase family protein [Sinorhizobium medicae]